MKKGKAWLVLVLAVMILAGSVFVSAVGIGKTKSGAAENIKLGLDLAGGVSITYQAKEDNPSEEDMKDTVYKLQLRAQNYSTEAEVYQEGSNRINVDIPGVSDANKILEEMGNPGSLLFVTQDGTTVLTGNDVKTAKAQIVTEDNGSTKSYIVALTLTDAGAETFATVTKENVGKQIAIIYDDEVQSSPTVQSAIEGGEAQITGMSSYEEAEKLASLIRIGSLKLELEEIRSNVVGAKLGQAAISTSLQAGLIGLIIIMIFMIFMYRVPGFASAIGLAIYTALVMLTLNAFDLTLTLPGIAGIILSIGMAVDANVIVFARIKEEIAAGRNVQTAIKTGFSKALSAIVDGNITTLIAALVLGLKGSGSVKGFAQTLAIGIVLSMFTALVITRLILNALYAVGLKDVKLYGVQKERKTVDFLSKKNLFFVLSLLVIIGGFVTMGVYSSKDKGMLNYSMEFKGGTSTTVEFTEDYTIEEIDEKIKPVVQEVTGDANIQAQKVDNSKSIILKTRTLDLTEREELAQKLADNFGVDASTITSENISAVVSNEMRKDAIISVILATICMLIYIWFRFKDVRFAASAVIALLHDVLVVLAFYAVARISVGSTFIACMLTIVGYSINATIVIFDRIRENINGRKKTKEELKEIVNISITQTLTRTIYSSFTTFVMVAVLFILGVASIREFAAPLMVGIICGAYSSVCITGALWYVLRTKIAKKEK